MPSDLREQMEKHRATPQRQNRQRHQEQILLVNAKEITENKQDARGKKQHIASPINQAQSSVQHYCSRFFQ